MVIVLELMHTMSSVILRPVRNNGEKAWYVYCAYLLFRAGKCYTQNWVKSICEVFIQEEWLFLLLLMSFGKSHSFLWSYTLHFWVYITIQLATKLDSYRNTVWNLTQFTPITVETVSANSKLFKQMSLCSMGLHCRSIRIKEAGYSIVVAITIK